MILPRLVPGSKIAAVRFAVIDVNGFGHICPEQTELAEPMLSDVQPNVVRMTFSKNQTRIDDGLRAPALLNVTMSLNDNLSAAELRAKVNYWHYVLQNARQFVTSQGDGVVLDPSKHDINGTGVTRGITTRITAKLVLATQEVFSIDSSIGVWL